MRWIDIILPEPGIHQEVDGLLSEAVAKMAHIPEIQARDLRGPVLSESGPFHFVPSRAFDLTIQDQDLHRVVRRLRNLFALTAIYEDRGWFLESDYFEGIKSKAIRKAIARLNREVRRDALGLVDAWAIPDAILEAPIVVGK